MSKDLKKMREMIMVTFGEECSSRGNGQQQGPEVRACLICARNSREPVWLGAGKSDQR